MPSAGFLGRTRRTSTASSRAGASVADHVSYLSADGRTRLCSFLVSPAACPAPAVVILRGVAGPDDGYVTIARRLGAEGFAALVHGWQVRGDDPSDAELLADLEGALAFLGTRPEVDMTRLAVAGYCRGGGQALLAAAAFPQLRVVVVFHGFARRRHLDAEHPCHPIEAAPRVRRPVLVLHGDADDVSSVDDMRALTARLQEHDSTTEIVIYPSARHGFAVHTHPGFLEDAAADSFRRAVAFLRVHLGRSC